MRTPVFQTAFFVMTPISPELDQQIRQVMRDCGKHAFQMAQSEFEISQKGPEDYVTSIDQALDRQLSAAFASLFPADGVITEENAQSRSQFDVGHARVWYIDPLDGTEDFIHGRPDYAVMVGLLQEQQPIAGWIYAPTSDRLYYGGQAWGLFQAIANDTPTPLPVAEPPPPTETFCPMIIGLRDQKTFGAAITHLIPAAQVYSLGSFGLKVMEVILGRAGLYVYLNGRVKLWDTVGPLALAKMAGLVCCDLEGRSLSFAPNDIDLASLAHKQAIVIGWPSYVEPLLPKLKQAVQAMHQPFG